MQNLARTSSAGTTYNADQFKTQWSAASGQEKYIFDRLDATKNYLSDLTPYVDRKTIPEITHDSTRAARRVLKIRLKGNAPLTPLHDLIRVHYQLLMPDGGFIDFTLGTFTVLPTGKEIRPAASWLDLMCPDLTQLLVDAGFPVSTGLPGNTNVIGGVQSLVSGYGGLTPIPVVIPDPGKVLPAGMGWLYGESPLKAINDLLAAINFFSAAADENGTLRSSAIPDWNQVSPTFTFDATTGAATVAAPINMRPDFSRAFNIAIVVIEDPRRPALSMPVSNMRGDSPISVPNWHQKTQVIRDSRVVDAATAYAVGLSAIQEAARVYNPVIVETLPWPASQDQDVYRLIYSNPDEGTVAANYVETHWVHRCKAGEKTTHTLMRIVPAGPS